MDVCHGMNGGAAKKARAKSARAAKRGANREIKEMQSRRRNVFTGR